MWAHVPNPQPDPLFALNARFKVDTDPNKLGLGVGAYRSEDGSPYVLEVCLNRFRSDLWNVLIMRKELNEEDGDDGDDVDEMMMAVVVVVMMMVLIPMVMIVLLRQIENTQDAFFF